MDSDKIVMSGSLDQVDSDETSPSGHKYTVYEKLVVMTLVDVHNSIAGIMSVIREGTFKPGHLQLFYAQVQFMQTQLELMREVYS